MDSGKGAFAAAVTWFDRRPQIADGALALGLWLTSLLIFGYGLDGGLVVAMAIQVAPITFRRVEPFVTAMVTAVASLTYITVTAMPTLANLAVPIVIYTVAATVESRWQRWVTLGVGLIGCVIFINRQFWYGDFPAGEFALLCLVTVTVWALGDVVRRRRAVQAKQRDQDRALARDQTQRVQLASQRERATIAREMHDIVAHSLSVVVVQSDGGAYAARAALSRAQSETSVDREALERAIQTLETVAGTARAALTDTRRLVGVLRESGSGAEYTPQQGLAHLDTLADNIRGSGIPVRIAVRGRIDDLTPDADLAAFRVVQESLTNVLKHAGAQVSVDIDIVRSPAVLMIRVSDDGHGDTAPASDGEGNGILGMTERVEVHGGTLYAGPRAGGGFEVVASLPVARVTAVDQPAVDQAADTSFPTADTEPGATRDRTPLPLSRGMENVSE